MRLYAEAYGCTLNKGEAGEFLRAAMAAGAKLVDDPSKANVLVIATCVVIDSTERKVMRRLAEFSKTELPVIVLGCASTTKARDVLAANKKALLVPPGEIKTALRILDAIAKGPGRTGLKAARGGRVKPPRFVSTVKPPFCANDDIMCPVPIASGCRGGCSYCITRLARGNIRSRSISRITDDVRRATASGAREIQLCAQDSGAYGSDIGTNLPDLLAEVCAVEEDFMVRIGMMNPTSLATMMDAVLDAFMNEKVYKFLHLPVQSGDDAILAAMGRKYTIVEAQGQMAAFRGRFPDSTISTDIIVGFPGETDMAHEATVSFMKRTRPDIVNVTRFSARPGTSAAKMINVPHGRTVKARSRELAALRMRIAGENNRQFVGRTLEVLATEKGKNGVTLARTLGYKQVVLRGRVKLGQHYDANIVSSSPIYLTGLRKTA